MDVLKPALSDLKAYPTLERNQAIKLDSNEAENYLFEKGFQLNVPFERYPDNHARDLKKAIAKTFQLEENQLLIGSGSSEILEWLMKSTVEKGQTVLTAGPTFVMYGFYAKIHELNYVEVPLNDDFSFNLDRFMRALEKENPRLVILCSPNNPTGGLIPQAAIETIIRATDALVLVDEAYIEFAKDVPSFIDRVNDYPNLMVTRTFSKAYGLASIRLGYAVSNPTITEALTLSKTPYNVNQLTQTIGLAAIQRYKEVSTYVKTMINRRERFKKDCLDLGLTVYDSHANFIFLNDPYDLFEKLKERNILVRPFRFNQPYIRITIGQELEMTQTLKVLKEILDAAQ